MGMTHYRRSGAVAAAVVVVPDRGAAPPAAWRPVAWRRWRRRDAGPAGHARTPIDRSYRRRRVHRPAAARRHAELTRVATELVEHVLWLTPGGGRPTRGVFLYADGRLIWNEYFGVGRQRDGSSSA